MQGAHEFTVILGASGTSGYGFWVFAAAVLAVAVALVWAGLRLRAQGYFERSRPTIEVFPELYAEEDVTRAA
jgi:hypothetical protein